MPTTMIAAPDFDVSSDRAGKAAANERKYPFIVEVPVAANGLDVELNRQIVAFHKSRGIPARFRAVSKSEKHQR
jgi:hypothetical protein